MIVVHQYPDPLADQPGRNRIGVIQHPDRAPAANLDRHRGVRGQRHCRQRVQMTPFLGQLVAEQGVVLVLDQIAHPALILFN